MERRVRLFIGGMEVEFKTVPDILYNFQVDNLTDPAAVKNSYSKTIQIPGTRRNNRIFDNFFLNDYRTGTSNFDASKKTEFTIYIDSDVYETGYCRLDSVTQNKHYWEYSVSLFGGLGEFFYNLSYSDNPAGEDEKKKLSDLEFYPGPDGVSPFELGFTINKETVEDAWENIDNYSSPYSVINFASAYNGLPSDFDADKVLMNCEAYSTPLPPGARRSSARNSVEIVTAVTEDDKTYKTYGGYAVADLSREYTAAEMREFRSYLMRPVLRVRNTIEAICVPANNGGWEVELDDEFFTPDNCYYWDMWMTLPMLSTLEYNSATVASGATVTLGEKATGTITTGDPGYYEDRLAYLSTADSGMAFDVNVKISLDINGCNSSEDNVVICAYSSTSKKYYASAILVQLVAYDAFGNPVAGSDVHYITSSYGARRSGRTDTVAYFIEPDAWDYKIPYGNGYVKSKGSYFVRQSGQTFRWNEEISLTARNVPAGSTLKILVTKLYKKGGSENGPKYVYYRLTQAGQITRYTAYTFNDFTVTVNSSTVAFKTNEGIRTGASFSKKQLLDTDFSPAEFLLSYMKIFGLYALKDTPEKKIKILTRKNFFKRDEIVDVQDLIDRSALKITPLVFDSKWYSWNLNADESEYGKAYENTYGKQYGQKKINTGYNFNKTTKEVLNDNIFKSGIQVLERSNAFCYTGNDTKWKPWMSPGYSYNLYNEVDAGETYEVEIPASSTIDAYSAFTEGYLYYDLYDKVQLHSADNSAADGTNVLLIHSGSKDLVAGSINLNYYITDDNSYMNILNDGRPCWLFTNSETDRQGNSIAKRVTSVPYFSRYKIFDASGYIVRSLDFGKPDEIYIPNAYYRDGSTLYEEFWQSYISDLYSKDSRVVRTKMLIRETPTVDWLRRFYAFDGAVWRMTSINDYNVGQDKLTEVEFVKVQDVENYSNSVINENPTVTLTLSSYSIPASGGTVEYTVSTSDGGPWYLEYWDSDTTVSATSGMGLYTGTWTIPASNGQIKQRTMIAMADNSSSRAVLTQEGYTLSLLGPNEPGNVSGSGGTRTFTVISPDSPWSAKTDYTGIIVYITPSQGEPTSDSGVTVRVYFDANDGFTARQAYIYAELPSGMRQRSAYVVQDAYGEPSTGESFTLIDTSGTFAWYSAGNIIGYLKRNVDTVYVQTSGAPWITSVVTGVSEATVYVESNATLDNRTGWILFGIDGETYPYVYEATQKYYDPGEYQGGEYLYARRVSGTTGDWYLTMSNIPTGETIECSYDDGTTWENHITSSGSTSYSFPLDSNEEKVLVRCTAPLADNNQTRGLRFSGSTDMRYEIGGNIMSIFYGASFSGQTGDTNIKGVSFYGNYNLADARNLYLPFGNPKLSRTFGECTNLLYPPVMLKYDSVGSYAFSGMFEGCTSLLTIPDIIVGSTGNRERAFSNMFSGCTGLVDISDKTIKTPVASWSGCSKMFINCTSLVAGPVVDIEEVNTGGFYQMFYNCPALTSLTLKATTMGSGSATSMPYYQILYGNSQAGVLKIPSSRSFDYSRGGDVIPNSWTIDASL